MYTVCLVSRGLEETELMTSMRKPFGKRQRSRCAGNCCSTEQHTEVCRLGQSGPSLPQPLSQGESSWIKQYF